MFVESGLEVKAPVRSLEGLIAWLERQSANRTYDWYDIKGCLICFYLQAHGYEEPAAKPGLGRHTLSNWGEKGYWDIAMTTPWTFGDALKRAKAALGTP